MKKLNEKEMNLISGGWTNGGGCPYASHPFLIEARQREIFESMKQTRELIAETRMRASEDALKAAMRIDRQEAAIKEAMKAQRAALSL